MGWWVDEWMDVGIRASGEHLHHVRMDPGNGLPTMGSRLLLFPTWVPPDTRGLYASEPGWGEGLPEAGGIDRIPVEDESLPPSRPLLSCFRPSSVSSADPHAPSAGDHGACRARCTV